MERNRAPFDLLEGERELIRGFNIEIGRLTFVFLFLREYGMIIIIALVASLAVKGFLSRESLLLVAILLFMRRCFPRVRYDVLISSI
jgi:NADH:ubiquinone oxidoreductase subunit H